MSRHSALSVLIPTPRREYRLISYAAPLDLEDAAAAASDVDFVPVPLRSRRVRLERTLRGHPPRRVDAPRAKYDACFFAAMDPLWIPSLEYVRNLKSVAKRVIVYLFDSWIGALPKMRHSRPVLDLVDDLIVSFEHSRDPYAQALPCRVHYLPQALNMAFFNPFRSQRPIDILSVGRRLPEIHAQILEYARREDLFYFFQEARRPEPIDLRESQELIGRICQASGVHVNWSFGVTRPDRPLDGDAITARWFEAAACAGRVIGQAPRSPEFARLFPLPEFVTDVDPGSRNQVEEAIAAGLAESSQDPSRLELANHVRQKHTWQNRWHEIVDLCGL